MSQIIHCQSISKSYGAQTLFTNISFSVLEKERLGLIGANGSGKSTLLKILAGLSSPDEGQVAVQKHTRLVYLPQDDELEPDKSIEQTLWDALSAKDLEDTEHYSHAQRMIGRAQFEDSRQAVRALSGGWRKRVAITRALMQKPDVLLLDEPTNHLDLEGILWLEETLQNADFAFVVVSHDRCFLENTSDRIIELGKFYPEGYLSVDGNYRKFQEQRSAFLENQQRREAVLANKMRRETEWLQRGPKARTTKARFRIDDAGRLQEELSAVKQRNAHNREVAIDFESTHRKTKKLIQTRNLCISRGGKQLFGNLNLRFSPGTRLGLMGRNGTGKSTLMHLLAGRIQPDKGDVEWAEGLQVVLFDQAREQLDQEQILRRALAPEGDSVIYRGRSVHVVTWAKRFLFRPDQLDMPVSRLSGGEQARILIARLMLRPADVLLLDEPTNDLDIPALEVLEESLIDFPGAIVLVTHDRFLLDRVANIILGLDGQGGAEVFADCNQWLKTQKPQKPEKKPDKKKDKAPPKPKPSKSGKLSYKDQYELDHIEENILEAEAEADALQKQLEDPEVTSDAARLQECCNRLQPVQQRVEQLYNRWEELENLKNGS